MGAWEELAKEEYERLDPNSKFDSLNPEMRHRAIENVKEKVAHRLYYLTGEFYGEKRFCPIFHQLDVGISLKEKDLPSIISNPDIFSTETPKVKYSSVCIFPNHMDAEQRKAFVDKLQQYEDEGEEIKRRIAKLMTKRDALKQEKEGKVRKLQELVEIDIKKVENKIKEAMKKYYALFDEARYLFTGFETQRFAELNDLEKDLFGILLREIEQKDLEKIRYDRWEEFDRRIRKKIIKLLKKVHKQEQWRPAGTEEKLNVKKIRYKLQHPKEYRFYKVVEMMMDNKISWETKRAVLEMINKNVLKAYKMLSKEKQNVKFEEIDLESQVNEQIEKMLKKNQDI